MTEDQAETKRTDVGEKHTPPLPWEQAGSRIVDVAGGEIAVCTHAHGSYRHHTWDTAALIVLAVNAHDDLVAALQEACDAWADQLAGDISACCPHFDGTRPGVYDGEPDESRMDPISKPMIEATRALISRLNAALAKARKPS